MQPQEQYFQPDSRHRAEQLQHENPRPRSGSFAFDLGHEADTIARRRREEGPTGVEGYRSAFHTQGESYATEYIFKSPFFHYEHELKNNEQGSTRLQLPGASISARESYGRAATDPSAPEWLRARAQLELEGIMRLEEELPTAHDGDMWIDISPTAHDVDMGDRAKVDMGAQSFIRIHQLVEDKAGERRLAALAYRTYLNEDQLKKLYIEMTGEPCEGPLLGTITRISSEQFTSIMDQASRTHLQIRTSELNDETPASERVEIPPDDQCNIEDVRARELMEAWRFKLDETYKWLTALSELSENSHPEIEEAAMTAFTQWQKGLQSGLTPRELLGAERELQSHTISPLGTLQQHNYDSDMAALSAILNRRELKTSGGSCGAGVGFGKLGLLGATGDGFAISTGASISTGRMDGAALTRAFSLNNQESEKFECVCGEKSTNPLPRNEHNEPYCPHCKITPREAAKQGHAVCD